MVERIDVLWNPEFDVIENAAGQPVKQLGLVQAGEGFCKRVVLRVAA